MALFLALYAAVLLPKRLVAPAFNRRLGALEYLFGHLRDHTLGVAWVGLAAYDLTSVLFGAAFGGAELAHVVGAALAAIAYTRHVHAGLAITEFMRTNPTVHPEELFHRYYDRLGPHGVALPPHASRTIDPADVDFTTGASPTQRLRPLARALYDTAIFARSAYRTLTVCGPAYGREVFDAMATLWGSRVLQLFRARLTVRGLAAFSALDSKLVLAFNHKSHLDFVFAFFALSTARTKDGRRLRVRYIAAKDHFVDNAFVYEWLGVGKLIEAVDMVFVDRRGQGKSAIRDAAQKLAERPIDVAIFPQGTRARPHVGHGGERLDAGYYTSQAAHDGGLSHLKKGAAHLALSTAEITAAPVHVVCVGIDGTATLVPKGAFSVQSETHVHFEVAGALAIDPTSPPDVEAIQAAIHRELVRATDVDRVLAERFCSVLQGSVSVRDAALLRAALSAAARAGNPRLFADIDFALCNNARTSACRAIAERLLKEIYRGLDAQRGSRSIEAPCPTEALH
jgi:1-acyl-sn-glycerol-3-phosphate acyltransferase